MAKKKKKLFVKKNGALKNRGHKKENGLKQTISELKRAISKKKGHFRNNKHICPVISSNLQDKIASLQKQLEFTREQLITFRKVCSKK